MSSGSRCVVSSAGCAGGRCCDGRCGSGGTHPATMTASTMNRSMIPVFFMLSPVNLLLLLFIKFMDVKKEEGT